MPSVFFYMRSVVIGAEVREDIYEDFRVGLHSTIVESKYPRLSYFLPLLLTEKNVVVSTTRNTTNRIAGSTPE